MTVTACKDRRERPVIAGDIRYGGDPSKIVNQQERSGSYRLRESDRGCAVWFVQLPPTLQIEEGAITRIVDFEIGWPAVSWENMRGRGTNPLQPLSRNNPTPYSDYYAICERAEK